MSSRTNVWTVRRVSSRYYKANYPKGSGAEAPPVPQFPKVTVPVLMIHGLDDRALHRNGLAARGIGSTRTSPS